MKARFKVGALGDSITTAFNAKQPGNNWNDSWAHLHAERLGKLYPTITVEELNVAASGARAVDLPAQADALAHFAPDYVTLLIGANDLVQGALHGTKQLVAEYRNYVSTALCRILDVSKSALIVLVAVPNQAQLLDLLPARLDPSFAAVLRRYYAERWEAFNETLATLARTYPGNVRFAPSVALEKFETRHLSPLDSYHPSIEGQQRIAELTWRDGWFPGAS